MFGLPCDQDLHESTSKGILCCFFSETQSISTAWDDLNDLIVTSDDSIIVSGRKQGKWKMLKYNLHDLRSLPSFAVLRFEPGGIAEVTFRGNQYLAVSNA